MTNDRAPIQASKRKPLDVAQALVEGHFVPFFQPLVTLRTGQLASFEVLARWRHPVEGLIPPGRFIPMAEKDGWIGELSRQIFEKAFVAASAFPEPLTLAINISPHQLRDFHVPHQICTLATQAGFPRSRIVVEITETALIDNLQSAVSIVPDFKKLGFRLALDDFGTGYSSLSHLQALPFDELKVDQSFVGSMTERRESRKIVSAVVGLGQSLGLTTVAEGIETQDQAEMMLWLGCELGQGYFYGRPMPAEELPACIAARRQKLVTLNESAWKRISATNTDVSPTQRLAQLQAVYDGAPVGLAFVDQNLRYLNLNQKLADMNGASVDAHLGNLVAEMIPGFFPQLEPHIRRALRGEAVLDVESTLAVTGVTRSVSYQPAFDEAGEVVGVAIAVKDITERKRMEDALVASEAHHRSIVELNPQVLWIMDLRGRNLDVSPRWDKKTGAMNSQSTDHEWLRSVHPADIQRTVREIAKSQRDGAVIDVQYRASDEKGNWIWKRSRGAPRFDNTGNIVCWYGSVRDVENVGQPTPLIAHNVQAAAGPTLPPPVLYLDEDQTEEELRSEILREMMILDTPGEGEFNDLVALASQICASPMAGVSFADKNRLWFKAAVGGGVSETPIEETFCAQVLEQRELLIVKDASKDKRFRRLPTVAGPPHLRFYAGLPLYGRTGVAVGTFFVIDTVPRTLSPDQVKALTILSHQVQMMMELRSERRKRDGIASGKPRTLLEVPTARLEEDRVLKAKA